MAAEGTPRDEGDYFPFTKEGSPKIEPPGEATAGPPQSSTSRSLTPRAIKFQDLSEAHRNITGQTSGRATSTKTAAVTPKFSSHIVTKDDSKVSVALPSDTPAVRLLSVKSQDDLQVGTPASKLQSSLNKNRRASVGAVDYFGDLSPRANVARLSLIDQMDAEMARIKAQAEYYSGSTIERLLEKYDVSSSVENTNSQQTERTKVPSSVHNTTIIDSQHVLDEEAQVPELKQAGRDLVPLPLNISEHRDTLDILEGRCPVKKQQQAECQEVDAKYIEEQYSGFQGEQGRFGEPQLDSAFRYSGPIIYDNHAPNPFAHPDDESYQPSLRSPMERDISRDLRRASGYAGYSAGTMHSAGQNSRFHGHGPRGNMMRPQARNFTPDSLPTVNTDDTPVHNIKIVIGRDSDASRQGHSGRNDPRQRHASASKRGGDVHSPQDDADWVTEATSDVGFGIGAPPMPLGPLKSGYKRTGDSIADYSDDENGNFGRFGNGERIIQHPARDPYRAYDVQTTKDSDFAVLLPRRQNRLPENANRRWENASQQKGAQFRSHARSGVANPFAHPNSKRPSILQRLAADVDRNHPAKHEFRDSQSEYEPAVASTAANCGTNWYGTQGTQGTQGTLPSVASEFEEIDLNDTDPDYYAHNRTSHYRENHQNPGFRLSMYEAERKKQLEKLNFQEFAVASPYEELPSGSSMRSKFNFELLPLDLARIKNKEQRDSGATNETESGPARIRRQKDGLTPTDPREPPKAFLTSRDLSIDFTPTSWDSPITGMGDTPSPYGVTPNSGMNNSTQSQGRFLKRTGLRHTETFSSFGTPSVVRRLWREGERDRPPRRPRPRPGFVAPDDYVSDRADRIRKVSFYILAALSILPFVGILVLTGAFSEALKWTTEGEVDRLTSRQRRFIKWMLIVEVVAYTAGVVAVVVYFVVKSRIPN
ncbi:hypothetical protein F5Y17DRAFT_477676 [Xylariaceae sp. FL0594]|nr:hypothetical protein F5Y17DRAFT_477676 [Xylariaceae sp. FL0594]